MCRIQCDRDSRTPILPCDYFHMMGGVGTGGLVYCFNLKLPSASFDLVNPFSILTFEWAQSLD